MQVTSRQRPQKVKLRQQIAALSLRTLRGQSAQREAGVARMFPSHRGGGCHGSDAEANALGWRTGSSWHGFSGEGRQGCGDAKAAFVDRRFETAGDRHERGASAGSDGWRGGAARAGNLRPPASGVEQENGAAVQGQTGRAGHPGISGSHAPQSHLSDGLLALHHRASAGRVHERG